MLDPLTKYENYDINAERSFNAYRKFPKLNSPLGDSSSLSAGGRC